MSDNRLQRFRIGMAAGMDVRIGKTPLPDPIHEFGLVFFIPLPDRGNYDRWRVAVLLHKTSCPSNGESGDGIDDLKRWTASST